MKRIIENIFVIIMAIWTVASFIDFVVCGQLAWHTTVELQKWNIGLIIYNWMQ
jgi:hypothetical protein